MLVWLACLRFMIILIMIWVNIIWSMLEWTDTTSIFRLCIFVIVCGFLTTIITCKVQVNWFCHNFRIEKIRFFLLLFCLLINKRWTIILIQSLERWFVSYILVIDSGRDSRYVKFIRSCQLFALTYLPWLVLLLILFCTSLFVNKVSEVRIRRNDKLIDRAINLRAS